MSTALDLLKVTLNVNLQIKAQRNQSGLAPITNSTPLKKSLEWLTGAAVVGGENQLVSQVRTLAASSSEDLDLSGGLANIVGEASTAFTRIKFVMIELLSPKDDATLGTLCSSITFGPKTGGMSPPACLLFFGTNADTITIPGGTLTVEGGVFLWATRNAAGLPVVNTTADKVTVTNNDGAVAAAYRITLGGGQ